MKTYSYSKLYCYDRCPWAYKKIYLGAVPREENEGRNTGKELHGKIEPYLNRLIRLQLQTDWMWAAAQESSSKAVVEVWEKFYTGFSLPTVLQDPGVERKLAFSRKWEPCEYQSPEAFFRMVIDLHFRQNNLAVVIDWKSGFRMPETVEDNLQLLIYGWGVLRAVYPDVQELLLQLYFPQYGKPRKILVTPEQLKSVPDKLESRIAEIENDQKFEPRPGSFCGMCGVAAHCPHVAQALVPREFIAPTTMEQIQEAAEQLLALRTMAKTITAHLRNWAYINGSISVGDLVYGPSFIDTLDTQKVVQALLDGGLEREEIWPVLSVSKTGLKSKLKKLKLPDLLNSVMSLTVGDPETRYDFKKADNVSDLKVQNKKAA